MCRMSDALVIRPETADDVDAVRSVHVAAFDDPVTIPALVDALRADSAAGAPISLVAVDDGLVVGHVMLSRCRLDAPRRIVDVLCLSPLGVLPDRHGRGIGSLLVAEALAEADRHGAPLVFLEGDPGFYSSRGFVRADTLGFRSPSLRIPPPAFQVAALSAYEPWMTGTFVYSDVFWALDCVGLRDPEG
jgi:putative acetyltransferase